MSKEGKTGVTENTPKNILFGAGTIHRGLEFVSQDEYSLTKDTKFQAGKTYYTKSGADYTATTQNVGADVAANTYYEKTGRWNFAETLVGATSGGSKLAITPEVTPIEVDGALVAVKGLNKKTGETATMEINFIELSLDMLKQAAMAKAGSADDSTYEMLESKADIEAGDYWENIAFVGELLDGRKVIVIMDNALCTNGLELGAAHKEGTVATITFACHAELDSDLDTLPWRIYYPKAA